MGKRNKKAKAATSEVKNNTNKKSTIVPDKSTSTKTSAKNKRTQDPEPIRRSTYYTVAISIAVISAVAVFAIPNVVLLLETSERPALYRVLTQNDVVDSVLENKEEACSTEEFEYGTDKSRNAEVNQGDLMTDEDTDSRFETILKDLPSESDVLTPSHDRDNSQENDKLHPSLESLASPVDFKGGRNDQNDHDEHVAGERELEDQDDMCSSGNGITNENVDTNEKLIEAKNEGDQIGRNDFDKTLKLDTSIDDHRSDFDKANIPPDELEDSEYSRDTSPTKSPIESIDVAEADEQESELNTAEDDQSIRNVEMKESTAANVENDPTEESRQSDENAIKTDNNGVDADESIDVTEVFSSKDSDHHKLKEGENMVKLESATVKDGVSAANEVDGGIIEDVQKGKKSEIDPGPKKEDVKNDYDDDITAKGNDQHDMDENIDDDDEKYDDEEEDEEQGEEEEDEEEDEDEEDVTLSAEEDDVSKTENVKRDESFSQLQENEAFGSDENYVDVSKGVRKHILKMGTGEKINAGDIITIHCNGYLDEDPPKKFWSTKDPSQRPFTFAVGKRQVIKGWDEGALSMTLRERSRIKIEPKKAYGKFGFDAWGIPSGASIILEIEVIEHKRMKYS